MIADSILKVIHLFNILIILFVFTKSYYDTIKSKNYRNSKKTFLLQMFLLLYWVIVILVCEYLTGRAIFEGFLLLVLGCCFVVPAFIFIIVNTLILRLVMKKKKYNSENDIGFRKYIVLFLVLVMILVCTCFISAYSVKEKALDYYKNKYGIITEIIDYETIIEEGNIIGSDRKAGMLFVLDNGEKIFYDFWEKEYYDNKQSDEIKNSISAYYNDILSEVINEFKTENENSEYLISYGYDELNNIPLYSLIVNADDYYDYKYYNEDEFYFNNYYNIDINNLEYTVRNILSLEELYTSYHTVNILCEKNGNWQQIMHKHLLKLELDIKFCLYDINSINERVIKNHKLSYSDESFAQYYFKDGEYVLKK